MDSLLQYVFGALPFLVFVTMAVLAVIGIGVGLVQPRFLAYAYLAVFFLFNSANYGNLSMVSIPGIYSRGSGVLLFPLLLWYLLGAWCCARVAATFSREPVGKCNLQPWFWAWLALLALHVVTAIFMGKKLSEALAPSGFSYVVWMAPLVSLLLLAFRTRAQVIEFSRFIMLMGLGRAGFGLARWALGSGDPNNVYANMNAIKIKLTFFDINDSLLCVAALSIAAVNLFQVTAPHASRFWRGIEWATLLATLACIVLSYRRSAWIGLLLAMIVIAFRFPLARRAQMLVVGLPAVGAALLFVAIKRLSQTKGAVGGGIERFFYDMGSRRFGAESERVLELKFALADFLSNPLTGIGSWGRYTGYQRIAWQTGPDGGTFIHSGVLHLALKSGLVGLVLFLGLAYAFYRLSRRALRELPPEYIGLGTAGVAGIAFMLPDFLIGTPIPQLRTTQMIAFCMALPYVALGASRAAATASAAAPSAARPRRPLPASVTASVTGMRGAP
jgi:hypothetical protein